MAKSIRPAPIADHDLIEYLDNFSEFAFELQVRKTLSDLDFNCEHGGTYDDPATQKPREFDIRATKTGTMWRVRLAVECKNLRDNFPLMISCVPRREIEAYHEIAVSLKPQSVLDSSGAPVPYAKSMRFTGSDSIYKPNEFVGKSASQVAETRIVISTLRTLIFTQNGLKQ